MEVLEGQNILITISGKKSKIRVYYLSWLKTKIFKSEGVSLHYGSSLGGNFDPHTGHCSLLNLRQFHLPQFASVYSAANEYRHCWEGTCDGLASRPRESVQLDSKLLVLIFE